MVRKTEHKRIDLTQFEGMSNDWEVVPQPDGEYAIVTGRDNSSLEEAYTIAKLPNLIAEVKKMYAREAELLDALRIIRDDLQEARAYGAYTLAQSEKLRKIRNFANDASQ